MSSPNSLPVNPSLPDLDAWILGSGLPSLAAAVYLIEEAKIPPTRVHILEDFSKAGGSTAHAGDPINGYEYRAEVTPTCDLLCFQELLSIVPSRSGAGKTALDDVRKFDQGAALDAMPHAHFLMEKSRGISCINTKKIKAGLRHRLDLLVLSVKSEKSLGRSRVCDHFGGSFFRSTYWLVLATTFGFQPWHSASEFRRCIRRFMHSTDSLEDAHPPVHGCINHHENITVPIAQFLESRGVDFQFRTKVTDIVLDHRNGFHMVSAIQCLKDSEQETTVKLRSNDIAIISLGSIMSGLATGSNTAAPSLESLNIENEFDENWLLWLELCTKHPKFGNAYNFCTRTLESRLETFTVTLRSAEFFSRLTALTGGPLGSMSLLTLKDSSWLLSIRVPQQPLFPGQPPEVQVFWGYAMRADKTGDFIKKPMFACAGREIMAELLHHLKFDPEMINDSVTVPCVVPRMTAPLLPRLTSDKPQIIPDETMNLALIGNFVYIPDEMVATTDYGVKGAKMAVRRLIGSHRN